MLSKYVLRQGHMLILLTTGDDPSGTASNDVVLHAEAPVVFVLPCRLGAVETNSADQGTEHYDAPLDEFASNVDSTDESSPVVYPNAIGPNDIASHVNTGEMEILADNDSAPHVGSSVDGSNAVDVMEVQCMTRLDVAMFNAILRESADDVPTDPVSDPISDARVLPISSGKASFGASAQLKNAIGNWSRWLNDLFGIDDDPIDDENDDRKTDASFKSFHLLNALSDLMTLPKDMLLSSTVRREACPTLGAPIIRRMLDTFVPDEFCRDRIPEARLYLKPWIQRLVLTRENKMDGKSRTQSGSFMWNDQMYNIIQICARFKREHCMMSSCGHEFKWAAESIHDFNSANGSDKIEEAIVVVKDLGGSVVEVDDVVSEDGAVIDGVKVSKGEDLGKSDDVASRDGEGGTEIENEGEVKVSESEIGGSNGGEVKASESEMGVNGGTVNKVSLEKKQVEISTKVSLAIGVSGLTPSLLLDFLLRTFENLIATEWFVVFNNFGSTLFTVFVGFFGAIWTLANALEYGREDLRKLLDGVNVKRIILPNGVKFEITGLKGASNLSVQIIGNEILRVRAIVGGRNIKHILPLAKGNYQFAKREAKFDPKVGQLNIELTDFVHAIDIRVDV
ncbi:hypothetical protein Tco_0444618 [Tanacetum coccineum]